MLLGCTPQAYKDCACPTSRPVKEPRVSNSENGLMDGGAYTSETRSWSDTPLCTVDGRWQSLLVWWREGRFQLQGN